ncbi:hypothetical protein ATANTOWER_022525 [Ataeniobius toweri]|uniref:Uncharacterized protein n=1 Tax=Ataeniobius toweri TaxID=208326 RepID=A0ABU7BU10_9TELE|nr:hypothetical protein [Ataeniobius toweri]
MQYSISAGKLTLLILNTPVPCDPIVITIQAFLQVNNVVPLSMTYQSLYVTKETQVAIAGIILAGVYVLIIFEVNGLLCCSDELFVVHCLWHSL